MIKGMLVHLSPWGKFILLIGLLISLLLISSLFGMLIMVPFMGVDFLTKLAAPDYQDPSMVNALKVIQIISMAGGLLLPALIYIYVTEKNFRQYLLPDKSRFLFTAALAAILIIIAQPLIGYSYELNSNMQLPASLKGLEQWIKNMEDQASQITDAFLNTISVSGFLVNIFMIALLPALCEEILFRGVLARLLRQWSGNMHLAIIISSIIFAGIHMQFLGFLPRFLLGIALGYLFFWSGNIWIPIIAHFTNNLLSVVVEFLYRSGLSSTNAEQFGRFEGYSLIIASSLLTGILLYYLYRIRSRDALISNE
jgi:uncharacterized protein